MTGPWDKLMAAADKVETGTVVPEGIREPLAWLLRREAGHAAKHYVELTKNGVPNEHALTLAIEDPGFIVADTMAADLCDL